jgi:hypothetical protein
MGKRYNQDNGTIIEKLVGMRIEKLVLKDYDVAEEVPAFLHRSGGDYRASLAATMEDVRGLKTDHISDKMRAWSTQSHLQEYLRRFNQLGEVCAQQWLNERMSANS